MKELIAHLQQRLVAAKLPAGVEPQRKNDRLFEYVDIDWGQVDFYAGWPPPVKFPAALIDIAGVSYSNQGRGEQLGIASIQLRIVELVLSNSSGQAPQQQRDRAFRVFDLVGEANRLLHGWTDSPRFGPLTRLSLDRVNRPDGLKEYRLAYQAQVHDSTAGWPRPTAAGEPVVTAEFLKE